MRWNNLRSRSNRSSVSELEEADLDANDFGLGDKVGRQSGTRLIGQDGRFLVERRGKSVFHAYYNLVEMSWGRFLLLVSLSFAGINILFGLVLLLLGEDHLGGLPQVGDFWGRLAACCYLSVQTFTTVGYGVLHPLSTAANLLASFIALTGLMSVALATGLFFSRFSRPRQLIAFSDRAIVAPYNQAADRSLQFRIANRRNDNLIDIRASVVLSWLKEDEHGHYFRRFAPLKLEREQVALFPLNWTIVHPIDPSSPLYDWSEGEFCRRNSELLITVRGYDEAYGQTIHANNSYTFDEVEWNARFVPMYYEENGRTVLELDKLSNFFKLEEEE